jgi:prepilin-type N-terminal cleavage/methylation domain-containing protein
MQRQFRRPVRRASKRGAFTLMEVMLVLVIIAAIAGIAVYNLGGIQNRAFTMTAAGHWSCMTDEPTKKRWKARLRLPPLWF